LTNASQFKLFMLPNLPKERILSFSEESPTSCLHRNLKEGSISGIDEDLEDYFNSEMKQTINIFVIFNNQTE